MFPLVHHRYRSKVPFRFRVTRGCTFLFLVGVFAVSLLSCKTVQPPAPSGPPTPARVADWTANRAQVTAFALQLYDDNGKPQPLQWIEDASLVKRFIDGIPAGTSGGRSTNDLTQATFVRLSNGQSLSFDLIDINKGQPGGAIFLDGTIPTGADLQSVIAQAYNKPDYSSDSEKRKEKETPATTAAQPFTEEALIADPTNLCELFTEVTLVIYQDNPGDDSGKKYAEEKAKDANTEILEAKGINSIINKLRQLRAQCKCVKTLSFNGHGSPGTFRIGPKNTPFRSATRVGLHPGQTSPADFGRAIKPYLCRNARIRLFSCKTAKNDGTPETNGPKAIQDLANAAEARVEASDQDVVQRGTTLSTQGNLLTALPGGTAPGVTQTAPVGILP